MSLEELVREIEESKKRESMREILSIQEQHEMILRAKDREISELREEIETLRSWLDHSALPAANPISKRNDSLNLIKMNFGKDKETPEFWSPGERELLQALESKFPRNSEPDGGIEPAPEPEREEALPGPMELKIPESEIFFLDDEGPSEPGEKAEDRVEKTLKGIKKLRLTKKVTRKK